jgi:hypothetical protein
MIGLLRSDGRRFLPSIRGIQCSRAIRAPAQKPNAFKGPIRTLKRSS